MTTSGLAKAIGVPQETLRLRQAMVVAVPSAGTCTIRFGGSNAADNISGVKLLGSAAVYNGDTVWVMQNGLDLLVLGTVNNAASNWQGSAQLRNGLELYHVNGTPFIDLHAAATPAGDGNADYGVRLIMTAANQLELQTALNGVRYRYSPTQKGHMFWDWIRTQVSGEGWYHEVHGGGWFMDENTYVKTYGSKAMWAGGEVRTDTRFYYSGAGLRDDILMLGTWGDYMWGVRSTQLMGQTYRYFSMDKREGGAARMFDWHGDNGLYLYRGWLRPHGDEGLYFENDNVGFRSLGNPTIITQNNETRIKADRWSQGGWADCGFENAGQVPQYAWHSPGERAGTVRKDYGAWNLVWVNQNGGCDNIYAANHYQCSERQRKRNISVVAEYGLKTIRGLAPQRFQYQPSTEAEIWATLKTEDERARGLWPFMVNADLEADSSWDRWNLGYMTDEIATLIPEAVGHDALGVPNGIDYGKLAVVAIAAINELADQVEALEAQLREERRLAA